MQQPAQPDRDGSAYGRVDDIDQIVGEPRQFFFNGGTNQALYSGGNEGGDRANSYAQW